VRRDGDLPVHDSNPQSDECASESVDAVDETGSFGNMRGWTPMAGELGVIGEDVEGQLNVGRRRGDVMNSG